MKNESTIIRKHCYDNVSIVGRKPSLANESNIKSMAKNIKSITKNIEWINID